MILDRETEKQLTDLLFELREGGRSKFVFALCDRAWLRKKLQKAVKLDLSKGSVRGATATVSLARHDVFPAIVKQALRRSLRAVHLTGIEKLPLADQHRALAEINFHRDALSTLGIAILLWLPTKLLPKLINAAPDLWSRRGAVYHFSPTSTKAFLQRLFEQPGSEAGKWKPEPILSEAFQKIFTAERALGQCLKDYHSFSLKAADELIGKINAGIEALVEECKRGRQIEVALWLWNLCHMDGRLQEILDSLELDQRLRYESLYTDRNEALLYLSKKLPDILRKYRESLTASIKTKKRMSLVRSSGEVAMSQLGRMARELSMPAQLQLPLDSGLDDGRNELASFAASPDSLFLEKTAADLERWLAGSMKIRPNFLSKQEAEILKLLYQHPGKPRIVARLAKMPVSEINQMLAVLQRKVSLYLGVVPSGN